MSSGRKYAYVAGLALVAVCVAMLFRKTNSSAELAGNGTKSELTWREQPAQIPYLVHAESGASPAVGLDDTTVRSPLPAGEKPKVTAQARLENIYPAPQIAESFQPLSQIGRADLAPPLSRLPFRSRDQAESTPPSSREPLAENPASAEPLRRHRLTDGDTLPDLAEKYLGSRDRSGEIYEANRQRIPAPDVLPIGVEILIPARD